MKKGKRYFWMEGLKLYTLSNVKKYKKLNPNSYALAWNDVAPCPPLFFKATN